MTPIVNSPQAGIHLEVISGPAMRGTSGRSRSRSRSRPIGAATAISLLLLAGISHAQPPPAAPMPPPPPNYPPPPPYGPPPYGYQPNYYPAAQPTRAPYRPFTLGLGLGVGMLNFRDLFGSRASEAGLSYTMRVGFGITSR